MEKKHTLPPFLHGAVTPEAYERWLKRKAAAHVKRDRGRGHTCTGAAYREAIHAAVVLSQGKDAYTGEKLDWHLISTYKNEESESGRHAYKAGFALLPTLDHVSAEATEASFKICGWRTNDAKNDMSLEVFLELCKKFCSTRASISKHRANNSLKRTVPPSAGLPLRLSVGG